MTAKAWLLERIVQGRSWMVCPCSCACKKDSRGICTYILTGLPSSLEMLVDS